MKLNYVQLSVEWDFHFLRSPRVLLAGNVSTLSSRGRQSRKHSFHTLKPRGPTSRSSNAFFSLYAEKERGVYRHGVWLFDIRNEVLWNK
jgi:hypothetical protein